MNVNVSRPALEDLLIHKNCELQLRDSPFNDGSLYLYCLDHEEFILNIGKEYYK